MSLYLMPSDGDKNTITAAQRNGATGMDRVPLSEPLEPPPLSTARGPPTDWGEIVQAHHDRDVFQTSPDELPVIDIHSL